MHPNRFPLFLLAAVLFLGLSGASPGWAQGTSDRNITPPAVVQGGQALGSSTTLPYRADRLRVQLTPSAKQAVGFDDSRAVGRMATSLATLDALNVQTGVQRIRRSHPQAANAARAARSGLDRWYTLDVPPGQDLEDLARRYRNNPNVEEATPDYRAFLTAVPNDPLYPDQWGHNNTGQLLDYCWFCGEHPAGTPVGTPGFDADAETAWDAPTGYGSSNVVIAILDTGVDLTHPDLNLTTGYDFGDNDNDPSDDSAAQGHGTACAGIAAAIANNGLGGAGVAGGCTIMPLKVADSAGTLYFSSIQDALVYAADNGADVASMSFTAGIASDPATNAALSYAYNAGVTLVGSTGNENNSTIGYPAINARVIAVGAASPCGERKRSSSNPSELNPGVFSDPNGYTCDGERWWGSNYGSTFQGAGSAVDVIAPTILPTTDIQGAGGYDPGNYSQWFNGTSASAPYVAGVCGLILSANPGWSPATVLSRIRATATDVVGVESGAGWDRYTGYGMVNAGAAVAPPVDAPVAEFGGAPTSGDAPLVVSFIDQSSNNPNTWSWSFGDGGSSSLENPSYTYTTPGTYTVSLTAGNAAGSDTNTKTGDITVTQGSSVTQRFARSDIPGSGTVTGSYLDTHDSDGVEQTITERESGGKKSARHSYLEHTWDFDVAAGTGVAFHLEARRQTSGQEDDFRFEYSTDNASFTPLVTVESPSKQVYSIPLPASLSGIVYVRVVDTDRTPGNKSLDSILIDQMWFETATTPVTDPPVAGFNASPVSGEAPLVVSFTDQSTNSPTSWSWSFGDGGASSAQNPSYTYSSAGTYTVSLTATNGVGSDTNTQTNLITVTQPTTPALHVDDISVGRVKKGKNFRGEAAVTVVDADGKKVANATVFGVFSDPNGDIRSATTGANGVANLRSDKTTSPPAVGNWCFTVTDVSLDGATYNPAVNVWTSRCEDGSGSSAAATRALAFDDAGVREIRPSGIAPNPVRSSTTISFSLAQADRAVLEVFDVAGRRVALLADEDLGPGDHVRVWDASAQSSGIYFYRLRTGDRVETRKMMVVR